MSPITQNTAVKRTRLISKVADMDFSFGALPPSFSQTMSCTASGYERRPARFFLSVPVHKKHMPQYRNQNAGIISHFTVILPPRFLPASTAIPNSQFLCLSFAVMQGLNSCAHGIVHAYAGSAFRFPFAVCPPADQASFLRRRSYINCAAEKQIHCSACYPQ